MVRRRTAVGIPVFLAAIVATAIVVAAVIFAAAPFKTQVVSTTTVSGPGSITTVTEAANTVTLTWTVTGPATTVNSSSLTCTAAVSGTLTLCHTTSTTYAPPPTTSTTASSNSTVVCSISGQPGPFYLRVVSDSNQTPIAGAQVTATDEPAYCNGAPATTESIMTFTTNSTEWYSLPSQNNAGYSITVKYSGQTYEFSASLRPVSVTCASLYIPSGMTNVTISEFQSSCPSTIETTSTG